MPNRLIEIPALDETRCTGCGDCIEACPVDCLESRGDMPWLPRPRDCISCGVCDLICPTHAIAMTCTVRK